MRVSRLEREAEAARVIYETFLSRLQETREQANLQTPDASFLTKATILPVPTSLKRLLVQARAPSAASPPASRSCSCSRC